MKYFVLFATLIVLASCKKDPNTELIGTWDFEGDHGEVTFNSDKSGYAILKNYSLLGTPELGYFQNACSSNDTNYFTWTVTEQKRDKGKLQLDFRDETLTGCESTSYPNYNFYPGGNELNLGQGTASADVHRRK